MIQQSQRVEEAGLGDVPERIIDTPYPEVAKALRTRMQDILASWREQTILEAPELHSIAIDKFRNDVDRILNMMADAMESNEREAWLGLAETAPSHGYDRFEQEYTLANLLHEERTLRRVIIEQIEDELDRQLKSNESASLHTAIDYMLQQGVLALAGRQKENLKAASESQLKYLSFLSHDLSNNLLVLRLRLENMMSRMEEIPQLKEFSESLAAALETIKHTSQGTKQLVEYQGMRKGRIEPDLRPVKLREIVDVLVDVIGTYAEMQQVSFDVRIEGDTVVRTDENLLSIILQNVINNAVKHANKNGGMVTIDAKRDAEDDTWTISVADKGPGMSAKARKAVLEACEKGDELGAPGLGLGLAIACQAATLLKTRITIETPADGGTIFSLTLPAH